MTARRLAAHRWWSAGGERAATPDAGSDEAAFRELHAHAGPRLFGFVLRRVGRDRAVAEDLLQETYYRLLRAPRLPADLESRTRWAFRIALNLVRDRERRERVRRRPLPLGPVPPAAGAVNDNSTGVREALEALAPRERDVLWLAYVEGASHREIASVTGVREASVRPILYRARRKLAALLRPSASPEAGS